MNNETERTITFFAMVGMLFITLGALICCGVCKEQTKKAELKLMAIEVSIQKELKETEEKCQRYCDACIHILSNNVWEEDAYDRD